METPAKPQLHFGSAELKKKKPVSIRYYHQWCFLCSSSVGFKWQLLAVSHRVLRRPSENIVAASSSGCGH